MRLQRRFLERAGHTVTVVAPAMHRPHPADTGVLAIPSVPITPDREYSLSWPGRRTDRWVDAAIARRPPVDLVHVQADFWGALIGHRFAARHALPVVHTMHNRVDVGIEATVPFPALVLRALNAWQRRALGPLPGSVRGSVPGAQGRDGWAFLRGYAVRSAAVTAPSGHFARRLEAHGVVPASGFVDVVWNGIDDELRDAVLAEAAAQRTAGRPRFLWLGRMSAEKRLLPFLEAVAEADVDARFDVIGGGTQFAAARRLVRRRGIAHRVRFLGKRPYRDVLARIAAADAVVQTSIGFETQGMTVFEAATLGTPSVMSDPDVADELGAGIWRVPDESVGALAQTLRIAASDIAAGRMPGISPDVAETFRQSSRTAAMLAVYARVLGG